MRPRLRAVVRDIEVRVDALEDRVGVLDQLRPQCRVCLILPATRITAIGAMCDRCEFPPRVADLQGRYIP